MKLLRLKLENWRAVSALEITFSEQVTLIEGPNEVGKSTVLAALRTLFDELDSSNKKAVKAIQPVGRDVASRVEAEVTSGGYHFVLSKTYNRDRATALNILSPNPQQLTGREAHHKALSILQETVDMNLWNALTVEQGKEIKAVHMADSSGLARALDEAAGSGGGETDDSDLYGASRTEYERYFTPKAGRSRLDDAVAEVASLEAEIQSAEQILASTEEDNQKYRRCQEEIQRFENTLPELAAKAEEQHKRWQHLESLSRELASKTAELETAQALARAVAADTARRQRLQQDLESNQLALVAARRDLPSLGQRVSNCRSQLTQREQSYHALQQEQARLQAALAVAREDEQHLLTVQARQTAEQRLNRAREYTERTAAQRQALSLLTIESADLERLREAERELQLAKSRRDMASSTVVIAAERDLELQCNEQPLSLDAGAIDTRKLTTELRISLEGSATITVLPPHSTAELEDDVKLRQVTLDALLQRFKVADLPEAITALARRQTTQAELRHWQEKLSELLDGETLETLEEASWTLRRQCENYLSSRAPATPLPADSALAATQREKAENAFQKSLAELAELQTLQQDLRSQLGSAEADLGVASREVKGIEDTGNWLRGQLDQLRATVSDDMLAQQSATQASQLTHLEKELAELSTGCDPESLASARAVMTNAHATLHRAEAELQQQRQLEAVLADRLERARADGEFERLQAATDSFEELSRQQRLAEQRAAAAQRLWLTLNKHRDEVRRAYARPLRAGIEQLGRVVFGTDFSIELGEDWALLSCTRGGATIPFDDLSVGMKEQLGILTRLAAARLVAGNGGAPLIIDDALGFSDPGRLETMGAAIATAGRDTQVIVLTCVPGRFTHIGNATRVQL